jgi:hypothetical protein
VAGTVGSDHPWDGSPKEALMASRIHLLKSARTGVAVLVAAASLVLLVPALATAHNGGTMVSRIQAEWTVRDLLWDRGVVPRNLKCGSRGWTFGVHFPCTFERFSRVYIVCYHSIDYDFGYITSYNRLTCRKYY